MWSVVIHTLNSNEIHHRVHPDLLAYLTEARQLAKTLLSTFFKLTELVFAIFIGISLKYVLKRPTLFTLVPWASSLTRWPLGDLNVILKCKFQSCLLIGILKSSYDNVLRRIPQNLTDDKSTLVPVMVWCRQATSHNLNHCWPRSPTPYGVTGPQ